MYPRLQQTIDALLPDIAKLSADRTDRLDALVRFIAARRAANQLVRLNFICTHNSRRSHLGQLWALTAAAEFGIADVETFSGGTEVTAFNPRAIAALGRAGFAIQDPGGINPHYLVRLSPDLPPQVCFSKLYDDPVNPRELFAAVMTCTDADANCPVVLGATARISLPYEDPKVADGTAEESARYEARSLQIATEMLYVFSQVAS